MIVIYLIGAAIYFAPTFVAFHPEHHNKVAIFAFNLLLGWTVLGWALAMVWALTATVPHVPRPERQNPLL